MNGNKESAKIFFFGGVAIFASMILIAPVTPIAHAQEAISGRYADRSGIQIGLPEDWSGTKLFDQILIVSPGGFSLSGNPPDAIMAIMSIDRLDAKDKILSSEFARIPSESDGNNVNDLRNCQNDVVTYDKIGQTTVLHMVQECKDDGGSHYSKTRVYGVLTLTKFVIIAYAANSASAYEKYVNEFEQSIKTVHIDEPFDFKTSMLTLTGANKVYQDDPTVQGKSVHIKIETSSKISNFQLSEGEKKISFRVEGSEGTQGVVIMPLQQVMEGPYHVTIDGNPATNFLIIEDKTTGEKVLNLSYHHSAHDIVITGGAVVPEFPLYLIALLGGVMGIITVLGRMGKLPISRQ